jgi:hypothetical protein
MASTAWSFVPLLQRSWRRLDALVCGRFRELAGVRPGNLKELASVHDE